jgi:prepilin signal peptidase PulO-like enzyme (type II secretory pathway)
VNEASVALAARLVLATVLAGSAIAKMRSRAAVRQQVETLVSARAAPVVAAMLPVTELVVAALLVVLWTPLPGVVALTLLVLFTVVLLRAQARRVPCLCFGASSLDTPVGPAAVVRNGVLAALAVLAIGTPSGASFGATLVAGAAFAIAAGLAVRAAR